MVKTASEMIPLQSQAPKFELTDLISQHTISLKDVQSDYATVIMFICNHCPFVKHVQDELIKLANDYKPQGIKFVAINSNDAQAYPDDSPEKMRQIALQRQYPFPYLYDKNQEVAKAYQATCTPDFFIFDDNLKLVYRGQLDDSRPGNDIPVTGKAIRAALNAILAKEPVDEDQKPSMGCNIKWKESNS